MKRILFVFFLLSIYFFNPFNCIVLNISPDTIITNNNVVNYQDKINQLNNEICNDNLNYLFKKEEINNNISSFKIEYISTINSYINSKNYELALEYLNTYFYLFCNDTQVLNLLEYLTTINKDASLITYSGDIEILSFNPIIAYPEMVLNKKNSSASKVDENNITCSEFEKILLSLYNKNYVLISSELLTINKQLEIPKNKKPLILILEDVEYNTKHNGSVEKLILDNNNQIATYTPKRSINSRIGHNNDFITILDDFILNHPSFSLNGAHATIAIDGSKGIFGYQTQKTNATSKYQIKKAIQIIKTLQSNGYSFISEGYNTNFQDEPILFAKGLNLWEENIRDIIDSVCNIFFLNSALKNETNHTENLNLLKSYNYSVIIGSEMNCCTKSLAGLTYLTARQINGKTLRYCHSNLSHLFDCEYVYDHINRHVTFNI